jgi:PTH2 family peptidyl-tRNA hydrolase
MSLGKLISQACHAAVEASELAKKSTHKVWVKWRDESAKKVILEVNSLEKLTELAERAEKLEVVKVLIVDRGLTEIPPNTTTALGIGPGKNEIVDKVTGNLKLFQ